MPNNKRIAFIDDRLDNFHADVFLRNLRGPLAGRGFTVVGATALQREPSIAWAAANNVPWFDDIPALAATADFFLILAPMNAAAHLPLCERLFPFARPTFVDKTFAPDLATARRIFHLAKQHNVPVQTSSALRYTDVQPAARELNPPLRHMVVWAGGATFEEYGVHPVELVISSMGPRATHLMTFGPPDHPRLVLRFDAGRTALIDFVAGVYVPFNTALTNDKGTTFITVDDNKLFLDATAAILDFFEAGKALVDPVETLIIHRILDAAKLDAARGAFVSLRIPELDIPLEAPVEVEAGAAGGGQGVTPP